MNHRGYTAEVVFDPDAALYRGRVVEPEHTGIEFTAEDEDDLRLEFETAVNDHLARRNGEGGTASAG